MKNTKASNRKRGRLLAAPPLLGVASHGFNRSWQREISAVGVTVEAALAALCDGCNLGELGRIEYQKHDGAPCEWFVRFTADGISMKAAGEYVRGGVIVTWWK